VRSQRRPRASSAAASRPGRRPCAPLRRPRAQSLAARAALAAASCGAARVEIERSERERKRERESLDQRGRRDFEGFCFSANEREEGEEVIIWEKIIELG